MEENRVPGLPEEAPREDSSFSPSRYDAAAIETWLEDRARAGWQLEGFSNWGNGDFQASEPRPTRYRLTPLTRKEKAPDEERLELCAAQGWEYAATLPCWFHVWRTDDPGVPEMDTDPVTQAEGYRWLRRRMARSLLLEAALILILAGLALYQALQPNGTILLYMAENSAPGEEPVRWGLLAVCLILSAMQLRGMNRTLRCLRAGIPMERPAPYRWKQRGAAVLTVVGVLAYLYLVFFSYFLDDFKDIRNNAGALEQAKYVDLTVLDPAVTEAEIWDAETKSLELIPQICRVEQYTVSSGVPRIVTDYTRTEYYRLLTTGLAEELERELVERYEERANAYTGERRITMERIPAAELDSFYLKDWPDEGGQNAVVRRGKSVLYVAYQGTADLREYTDYLAELLS